MSSNVTMTLHADDASRCVKIVKQSDGAFGFDEYRRDPEDAGGWTLISSHQRANHATEDQALAAARAKIGWLRDMAPPAQE